MERAAPLPRPDFLERAAPLSWPGLIWGAPWSVCEDIELEERAPPRALLCGRRPEEPCWSGTAMTGVFSGGAEACTVLGGLKFCSGDTEQPSKFGGPIWFCGPI